MYFGNNCLRICSKLHRFLLCRDALFSNPKVSLGRTLGSTVLASNQYSCLENPMDRVAWWPTVHGVAKSQTQLSDWAHTHSPPILFICCGTLSPCIWPDPLSNLVDWKEVRYRPWAGGMDSLKGRQIRKWTIILWLGLWSIGLAHLTATRGSGMASWRMMGVC